VGKDWKMLSSVAVSFFLYLKEKGKAVPVKGRGGP
jgi:hypothetical protein